MAVTEPSARRLTPVRLTDIPLAVRCAAAQREARHAKSQAEAADLLAAALSPSETVYWVTGNLDEAAPRAA